MANEKRLVNAEAIARKLKNAHCAECHVVRKIQCSACWVEDVLELLEGDAVEVVHGKWNAIDECANSGVYCSVCHRKIFKECYGNCKLRSNYCPNCGAKMDGDGNG